MTSTPKSPSAVAAAKGVLYSILLRLLSFSLSQLTIRLIDDPKTLGYSTIQLELLCSTTILFLSREGFRLSLVRVSDKSEVSDTPNRCKQSADGRSKLDNVAWLTIPFGMLLSIISLCIHLHQCKKKFHDTEGYDEALHIKRENYDYKIAGVYYCVATIIELVSEPCLIHCLQTFKVEIRAKAEGIASIAKAFTSVVLLSSLQMNEKMNEQNFALYGPISTFGVSQLVYSFTLSTTLFVSTRNSMTKLKWPLSFHRKALSLSITFTIQSIFKHFLTEGDRIILSTLVSSYNSGIYAMVSSYGSIVSRMIFLPLEENGRLLFSHYHTQIVSLTIKAKKGSENNDQIKQEILNSVRQLEKTYVILVKLVLYVGFFFISFGTNYTTTLLQILAGSNWGSNQQASATLAVYCSYIFCMALNGMTEAFVYGVVDDKVGVGLLTIVHGVVGFVFYILAPALVISQDRGTVGLIIANEICMLLRSLYSLDYAATYFLHKKCTEDHNAKINQNVGQLRWMKMFLSPLVKKCNSFSQLMVKVLPSPPVLFTFILSYKLTNMSKLHFLRAEGTKLVSTETGIHLGIGISLLVLTVVMIWKFESIFLQSLQTFVSSNPKETEKKKIE